MVIFCEDQASSGVSSRTQGSPPPSLASSATADRGASTIARVCSGATGASAAAVTAVLLVAATAVAAVPRSGRTPPAAGISATRFDGNRGGSKGWTTNSMPASVMLEGRWAVWALECWSAVGGCESRRRMAMNVPGASGLCLLGPREFSVLYGRFYILHCSVILRAFDRHISAFF